MRDVNFREFRKAEVQLRRVPLLGSWVNKGYLGCECEAAFEMVDVKPLTHGALG